MDVRLFQLIVPLYEHGALLCLTACQTQAVLDLSGGNDVTITVQ